MLVRQGRIYLVLGKSIKFEYRDDFSTFSLWWKTILLLPLWSFPVVIIFGLGSYINEVFPITLYVVSILLGILYFLHDFRKQFLIVDRNNLWCGLRSHDLDKLEFIALDRATGRNQPSKLCLYFQNNKTVKLNAKRFKKGEISRFLQHLESKFPGGKMASGVRELIKQDKSTESVELILRISPHIFMEQMRSGFGSAQKIWSENSFLFIFVLCSPIWLMVVYALVYSRGGGEKSYLAYEMFSALGMGISYFIYQIASSGVAQLASLSKESFLGIAAFAVLLVVAIKYAKLFLSTQCLQLEEKGILLKNEFSGIEYFSTVRLLWEDAKDVRLESNILTMSGMHESQNISIDLSSLNAQKKTDLLTFLSKKVQSFQMDTATQEALLPKQNMSYTELWLQSLTQSPSPQHLLPLQEGRKLNEETYTIKKIIGGGGQGTAYLGTTSTKPPVEVVLKEVIFPVHVDKSVRKQNLERFEQEANLLKTLSHPGIVKLTDYFVEDHRGYLVLEYIEGEDLRTVAEREKFTQEEALLFLKDACSALSYLHSQGFLHRDLSPDNFIRTKDGQIKLIDFEVSRKSEAGVTATIVGKHAYISPEQFRGKTSFQSDIYSLGATLYFLLTGVDPEPISQSLLVDGEIGFGTALDTVIRNCTDLNLEKRFQSVKEIEEWLSSGDDEGTTIKIKKKEEEVLWRN